MGPCSSKSKATIPLGLGKAGGFCPTAVVGKSKGLFGGEPGVGLSRELPCSCLRELAILSLEEAEYVEEGSSDPMIVGWETPQVEGAGVATTLSHLRPLHLALCDRVQAPVPQQAALFSFLQYLKVGGTSVKHPVTPSFLTAQGKWR